MASLKQSMPADSADYISDVFGPSGCLSRASSSYEPRVGQIALSRAIDHAIRTSTHVLAEGPCGTGKGFAYAVPAIYHAHHHNKKIIIVTANLALQDQLMQKDLPALQAALPWSFTFTALKGKSNYLCKDKLDSAEDILPRDELYDWAKSTTTGEKRELPVVPSDRDWALLSTAPDECVRETCAHAADCFYYKAKHASEEADITVTNIHVLGAHLSLFQTLGMDIILPPHDILIFDEAHEVPNVMRTFFGFSVTEKSLTRFVKQVRSVLDSKGDNYSRDIEREAHQFFREVQEHCAPLGERTRLVQRENFVNALPLLNALSAVQEGCVGYENHHHHAKYDRLSERAGQLFSYISECVGQVDSESKVYWVEFADQARRFPRLEARPLEVGGIMRKLVFDRTDTVCLVSATLTTTPGNFRFMRRELGVPTEALQLEVPSPFDMKNQCLVVLPVDRLPDDPKDDKFIQAAADIIGETITACGGRTLALFTSFRNLEGVRDRVVVEGELPILCQERGRGVSKAQLLRRFRDEPATSLFGVESFWTGVDVPGESLTALVIDKLPFAQFNDPLIEAMKAKDEEQFWKWYNASCLLKLRQGMGRLIRSVDDIGVIVLLDKRLNTKQYGKHFVKSFGAVEKSRYTSDIAAFLEGALERTRANRAAFRAAQERTPIRATTAPEPAYVPDC